MQVEAGLAAIADRLAAIPTEMRPPMVAFLTRHPFARLLRDGVRDHKFTVAEVGGSQHFGSGSSAVSAWQMALDQDRAC